jgi:hypothetical protein
MFFKGPIVFMMVRKRKSSNMLCCPALDKYIKEGTPSIDKEDF